MRKTVTEVEFAEIRY
jgi:hypothetical protein